MSLLTTLSRHWRRLRHRPRAIPDGLWGQTLGAYPFLQRLSGAEQARLRRLCAHFLARKEFTGAHGLRVTDGMSLAVAAQACLPLLHLGPAEAPEDALHWYDDFVGIVMHPDDAVARRQVMDAAGVLHHYDEVLSGEAMQGGPVMLSWPAVQQAGREGAHGGYSVVIHEFVHKMDMQAGGADGAPPLPAGFMGTRSAREAAALWQRIWLQAFEDFRRQVVMAERFGAEPPWLDAYAATAPAEFFAVASEAHFVQPERFAQAFPTLAEALRAFFRQDASP